MDIEIELRCVQKNYNMLQVLLENKGFRVTQNASVTFVERGQQIPEGGISILFDVSEFMHLNDFLEHINGRIQEVKENIIGKIDDKYEIIPFNRIICFESFGNDVFCITEKSRYSVKQKLYELEESLVRRGFVRINKSEIVNIQAIEEIVPWFDSRLVLKLKNNLKLEVSKKYSKSFKNYIGL